jgi:anti-sigma regulatory factor (Ser/Thr protein kinase)
MRSPPSPERLDARTAADADHAGLEPRDLRIPAVPSELKTAREHVQRAAAALGFDPRASHDIVFAVNEAVTNAIRHGTPDDAGTIGLVIEGDRDGLTLVISDSGAFVPSVPDASPLAEQGRGFVYMASLMDEVDLTKAPEGTVVRLRKRRAGSPARNDNADA